MALKRSLLGTIREMLSLYAQLLFVVLAFVIMVVSSCLYVSNMLKKNLQSKAEETFFHLEALVTATLTEPRTAIRAVSNSIRSMILDGDSDENVYNYMRVAANDLRTKTDGFVFDGLYGHFNIFGNVYFTTSTDWVVPENYDATTRPWYTAAVAANGEVAFSPVYWNVRFNDFIVTVGRQIFDDDGNQLAVIALNVPLYNITNVVVNTWLSQGGYGFLMDENFMLITHGDESIIGKPFIETRPAFAPIAEKLEQGLSILAVESENPQGDALITYYKKLENSWYLGLTALKNRYYAQLQEMALIIIILGTVLAAVLILILIRIEAAKNKADEESRHKSNFLSNMSHEIRTPLNAIIGMTAIGKRAESAERKDYTLNKIADASTHLLSIINDILDMSKIEANRLELSPVEFDFRRMLNKTISVINFRIDEKKQKLTVKVDEKVPRFLVGDDHRLTQIIMNLISNAVKFTPEMGEISLEAYLAGENDGICELRIEVTDTGIGISPEQQAKLFQVFTQAESGISRDFGGTGLGLAISKKIVELMDGEIWVESKLGHGARFIFTVKIRRGEQSALPLSEAIHDEDEHLEKKHDNQDARADTDGRFKGKRVLLADDIEINREIMLSILDDTGLIIDCAENGKEALDIISGAYGKYDIVFMDVQMPEMDGLEATRQIRSLDGQYFKKLPIIAMTARVFKEDIETCLAAGMNSHVGKPINFDDVLSVLRTCL
ncbi:MAG: response regulator [Treponema sp.]|jgi:signal transduction histidine kinase|nr:response regulator [Treponema sp.]